MSAAEDQGWKQAREDSEAVRLMRQSPRWCELCKTFGNHHTDRHAEDELASDVEVKSALAEARSKISKKEH